MRFQKIFAGVVVVLLGSAIVIARANIRVHKDETFDFKTLKTFAWSAEPGMVKISVSIDADAKAEPAQRKYEPILMAAVTEEMVKRGYANATSGTPDFRLTYYVLITAGSAAQYQGQFLPQNAQFGLPLYPPSTTAFRVYTQGAIVLDITSPVTGPVVWRGVAEAKVEEAKTDDERAKRARAIIKDLVARFPKRQ